MDAWGYTDHDWRRIRQVIDYIRTFPRACESRGEVESAAARVEKKVRTQQVESVQLGLPLPYSLEDD